MFSENIYLINDIPRETIDKICEQVNRLDESFAMTMLVLLYNRVDNLKINIVNNILSSCNEINNDPSEYSFYFISVDNPDEFLKPVKNKFKTIEKLPTYDKFLSEKVGNPIHIRLMPNENTACVFTPARTLATWHAVQFFIPKYYKVFKEKPVTQEEIAFLESLTFKMSSSYIAKLTELARKDSFRTFVLRDQISAFEKKLFSRKVMAAKNQLNQIEKDMQDLLDAYKAACNKRLDAAALVCGLEQMTAETQDHTELQDYIMNNKRISCIKLSGSTLSFIVKTYLAPHHVDEYETMSKRDTYFSKYILSDGSVFADRKNVKLLMDAIFSSKRTLKLRLCAYFYMDYFGSEVSSVKGYNYVEADKSLKDYIPNPHIDNYNCFSQNKAAILEHLKMGDPLGAIESSIACAQRINIHESMNFDPFMRFLFNFKNKCLVAEDGTELSPAEAVVYLKEKTNE